jgi:hypothetical protein
VLGKQVKEAYQLLLELMPVELLKQEKLLYLMLLLLNLMGLLGKQVVFM